MKADAKPTLETVAALLGAEGVDWAVDRLRRYSLAVHSDKKDDDDTFDRLAHEAVRQLQIWLSVEARAYDALGEDCADELYHADTALTELLPLIEAYRRPTKRGKKIDQRRHICAGICASIWREFHSTSGANSDILQQACEDYWQACANLPPLRSNPAICEIGNGFLQLIRPKNRELDRAQSIALARIVTLAQFRANGDDHGLTSS